MVFGLPTYYLKPIHTYLIHLTFLVNCSYIKYIRLLPNFIQYVVGLWGTIQYIILL